MNKVEILVDFIAAIAVAGLASVEPFLGIAAFPAVKYLAQHRNTEGVSFVPWRSNDNWLVYSAVLGGAVFGYVLTEIF